MRSDVVALARIGRWLTASWAALRFERLIPLRESKQALAEMGAELFTIMGELSLVDARRIPFAKAVRDSGCYPHLARVHQGLEDILTLSLPEPLRSWAEDLLANPPVELLETLDATFARAAIDSTVPGPLRRLARFALFEGTRINLVVMDQLAGDANLAASGITMEKLDEIAEREIEQMLALPPEIGTPSLAVAVKAGVLAVGARARELAAGGLPQDFIDDARARAVLNRLDARNAILLRAWAEAPDGKLDPHRVLREHAVLFAGAKPGALSTRLSRLRERLDRRERPPRRDSLVDIIARLTRDR